MLPRSRLLALCLLPVVYVAVAAVRATGASSASLGALLALPVVILGVFRLTEPGTVGEDLVGDGPRAGARIAAVGTAIYIAARAVGPGRAGFDAAAASGVGLSGAAALFALARVPEARGLLEPEPAARRLDGAFALLLIATIAATVPAIAALSPTRSGAIDPLTIDYALVAEGASALLLLSLSTLRFRVLRRLELGVVDRASAAFALALTAFAVALPASVMGFAPPDRVLPAAALLASIATCAALVIPDPLLVARGLRLLLVLCLLGTPIALFTAGVAAAAPRHAGATVIVASVVLLLLGALSGRLSARLLPETARWIAALGRAQERATLPEPQSALRATLTALRDELGPSSPSPVLFRLETGEKLSVDRAGYLHEAKGQAPVELLAFCDGEPEHTFRLEVARALEVRHPEVRPTLAWMDAHGFASVTSLRDEEGPVGLLAMPRGKRRAPLTLEEVLALSRLTERVASVFALSSSLAGARARQLAAEAEARASEQARATLAQALRRQGERYAIHARRTARLAPLGRYSPEARLAEQELESAARAERPIVLLTPPGVSAEGFAAAAHLQSSRSESPFVLVSGSDAREHPIAHWTDEVTSPFRLALHGTLVILDLPALPADVQRLIAQRLRAASEAGPEAAPRDLFLLVSVRETVDTLAARGRLIEELADALGDRALPLPRLSSRPEDIRPIALEILSRMGLSLRGTPVGLGDDALEQLLEHSWPLNDQELELVLLRALLVAPGPALTAADLRASGFSPLVPRRDEERGRSPLAEALQFGERKPRRRRLSPGPRRLDGARQSCNPSARL